MNKFLTTTALLAALATPAAAASDTAIIMFTDGSDAVTSTGNGSVDLGPQNLDGVNVTLTFGNKGVNPNELNEANILITNTTDTTQTLSIILGANGYAGPSNLFKLSGAINLDSGGADLIGQYYVDSANGLNGTGTGVTGLEVGTFDTGALTGNEAFSFNGFGADSVTGLYGMAEGLTLTLKPGASVGIQGVSIEAVKGIPEPSTWVMMGGGFALLGLLGLRKRRQPRFAV
jgi:PEP-CTERM motif